MKDQIYFSIIVPVYRVEKYLKECVDSILAQTFHSYEVILVDDGSDDKCPMICEQYKKKCDKVHVIHKENGGLSDARNAGLEIAEGKYVLFIDSDDLWLDKKFLSKLHQNLSDNEVDCVIYSQTTFWNDDLSESKKKIYQKDLFNSTLNYGDFIKKLVYSGDYAISAWTKSIKREVVQKNNLRFQKGFLSEDIDWTLSIYSLINSLSIMNEPVYGRRKRKGSISQNVSYKHCVDIIKTIEIWKQKLDNMEFQDNNVKAALYAIISYYVFLLMGLVESIVDSDEKNRLRNRLKPLLILTRYGFGCKYTKCRLCYLLFGEKICGKLFKLYIKISKKQL